MRPRSSRLALLAVLLASFVGCTRSAEEPASLAPSAEPAAPPPVSVDQARAAGAPQAATAGDLVPEEAPVPAARKLVKTVDLQIRVADTEVAAQAVQETADELGGYVSELSAQRRDELLYYSITLRIPVDRLEEAVAAVKEAASEVDRESIRTEDVTDRYVDLEARLLTLRATEDELRQLLAESRERGQKVEDIMAVYRELTGIRSQIEQIQGQLQSLQQLTALSTVNVEIVPTEAARPIAKEGWQPSETVRRSARALVGLLRGLVDLLIILAIVGLPLALLVALPIWGLVVLGRWLRRRRQRAATPPSGAP